MRKLLRNALAMGMFGKIPWYLAGGVPKTNCNVAYQFIGAASQAASYINLVNPGTNNIVDGVAPTWDAVNGLTFNGTTQLVNIGPVSPALKPGQNSSFLIRYTTTGTLSCGAGAGGKYFCLSTGTGKVWYGKGDAIVLSSLIPASGVIVVTNGKGYINTLADKNLTIGTGAVDDRLYIGAVRWAGGEDKYSAFSCQAFAMYDIDITPYLSSLVGRVAALP